MENQLNSQELRPCCAARRHDGKPSDTVKEPSHSSHIKKKGPASAAAYAIQVWSICRAERF